MLQFQRFDAIVLHLMIAGSPAISMFLAPAVTPWFSTIPGTGSNNPGIRLFRYARDPDLPRIVDYSQYYVNLTKANADRNANWIKEYQASDAYGVRDLTPSALSQVILNFQSETETVLFDRYYQYNSVSNDLSKCTGDCKRRQVCATWCIDYNDYAACVSSAMSPPVPGHHHRFESSTFDPDDPRHGHHRGIERFTFFILGALVVVIVVLFAIIALCCCHRRHAVIFFRRSKYMIIQDSA